jgi:DNA topoisomerase I
LLGTWARRRGRGTGFEYVDEDGDRIDDPEIVDRIGELRIPPAWGEVWICADPLGHLQATGDVVDHRFHPERHCR